MQPFKLLFMYGMTITGWWLERLLSPRNGMADRFTMAILILVTPRHPLKPRGWPSGRCTDPISVAILSILQRRAIIPRYDRCYIDSLVSHWKKMTSWWQGWRSVTLRCVSLASLLLLLCCWCCVVGLSVMDWHPINSHLSIVSILLWPTCPACCCSGPFLTQVITCTSKSLKCCSLWRLQWEQLG